MKIFLYGHYDSRGGTTAIEADSKEEADEQYLTRGFCFQDWTVGLSEEEKAQCREGILDDYIGEFELEGANDALDEQDLEYNNKGWVVVNKPTFFDVAMTPGIDEETISGLRLRYVEFQGDLPESYHELEADDEIPSMPGWYHPRWDDDAYSFVIYRKQGKEE